MKRIIFIAFMALSLSACDQTKLKLRAPGPASNSNAVAAVSPKSDTVVSDTIKKDSVSLH